MAINANHKPIYSLTYLNYIILGALGDVKKAGKYLKKISISINMGNKLQFSAWELRYTDGSKYHSYSTGVPTIVIGVPVRHIHSHGSTLRIDYFNRTADLLEGLATNPDQDTVAKLT